MRISVVGTSGSGKTTAATRLAAKFDLPLYELDAILGLLDGGSSLTLSSDRS